MIAKKHSCIIFANGMPRYYRRLCEVASSLVARSRAKTKTDPSR